MPGFSSVVTNAVNRNPKASILATITLATAAVVFSINGSGGNSVLRCAGTGCVVNNLEVSGTLTNAGSPIGGGMSQTNGDARYLKKQGDTATGALNVRATLSGKTLVVSGNASVTGAVVVKRAISGAALEVLGTASGKDLFATKSISGTYLYTASTFGGAGLTDCSNSTTSKLLWNAAAKQFSCGTDQTGGASAPEVGTVTFSGGVLRLGDARYLKTAGGTVTGSLAVRSIMSGNTLNVSKSAVFSGSGIVFGSTGNTIFNILNRNVDFIVKGQSDNNLLRIDASADRVGIGTALPKAKLDVLGTLSGKTLTISGNASVSGSLVVNGSINKITTLSGSSFVGSYSKDGVNTGSIVLQTINAGTVNAGAVYVLTINGTGSSLSGGAGNVWLDIGTTANPSSSQHTSILVPANDSSTHAYDIKLRIEFGTVGSSGKYSVSYTAKGFGVATSDGMVDPKTIDTTAAIAIRLRYSNGGNTAQQKSFGYLFTKEN